MLEVEYNDSFPWPAAADGNGHSHVLARPSYREGNPFTWEKSTCRDGSPGVVDPAFQSVMDGLVIKEILANADLLQVAYLEIYNYGTSTANLAGLVVTDGETITNTLSPPAQPWRRTSFWRCRKSRRASGFPPPARRRCWSAQTRTVCSTRGISGRRPTARP